MGVKSFSGVYNGRCVLVTGHTGFKGSWLAHWLQRLGAEVTGIALSPDTAPNHWDLLKLKITDHRQDIRDANAMAALIGKAAPEIVFHLAAQPLVRRSYREPLLTWETNVMGTANVLEACRKTPSVKAIVVVTTDKCYENSGQDKAYREDDRLGGHDPYSASKAAAEVLCASFRDSFLGEKGPLLATARAGNVIGGGDWSEDRLIPDLVRAAAAKKPLVIRSPKATRPWQHVLEPLAGYLMLGARLLQGERDVAGAWNFGPGDDGCQTVENVLNMMQRNWPGLSWQIDAAPQPHEAKLLRLDSSKAKNKLGWAPVWSLAQSLDATAGWYRRQMEQGDILTAVQLETYVAAAQKANLPWTSAA